MSFVSEFCCQNWRRQSKPLTCVLLFSVLLIFFIFLFTSVSKTRNLQLQPCHYLVNLTRTPQKLWRPWRTTSQSWSSRTRRQRRYEFESNPCGYYEWITPPDNTCFITEIILGNSANTAKKCVLSTIGEELCPSSRQVLIASFLKVAADCCNLVYFTGLYSITPSH